MKTPTYEVELRVDGTLIGNVRKIAQNLTWAKRRTRKGADEIDFTLNDRLFADWLAARNYTINEVLRPFALDCRIVRDGVPIIGGFLATMPSYAPIGASANLQLRFDGYLNLLDGVYIYPTPRTSMTMDAFVRQWITMANTRSSEAGKGFGFTIGDHEQLANVTRTFDGYSTVKHVICLNCDNVEGAGPFDVEFGPEREYSIASDAHYGTIHSDYVIKYPASINSAVAATSIQAPEVAGFASKVIALGAGETSADESMSTIVTSEAEDLAAVARYGYHETLYQNSSISTQSVLDNRAETVLANATAIQWEPQITLSNFFIKPGPATVGDPYIWIGDTITVENDSDLTGQTSGRFRVMELSVRVSATGAETIVPMLERVP